MFESTLLFEKKQSRKKAMAAAVFVEVLVITFLIFSPLFFKPADFKKLVLAEQLFLPPRVPPGPPGPGATKKKTGPTAPKKKQETKQAEIPKDIAKEGAYDKVGSKKEVTESIENTGGVPGGKPCEGLDCVAGGTGETKKEEEKKEEPPPPPPPPRKGGNVKQAKLIKRVEPIYPTLARQSRIQGNVILEATIGTDGKTHNIKVLSGHTFLRQSAIDAVEKWEYEPATLNGEPTEVETNITVKYVLK